jgi:predicted RNase H-like nuclease
VIAGAQMRVRKYSTFREIANSYPEATIVVDVPIGLFEDVRPGGRECDRLARQLLGYRSSSVFSAPARRYLAARRFEEVLGMSIQSFSIRDKVKEVDDFIAPERQNRILEGHPEVSFARLVGRPMQSGKKTYAGNLERREALRFAPGDPFSEFRANPRASLQSVGITNVDVDDGIHASSSG